jgi:hypothetical protein
MTHTLQQIRDTLTAYADRRRHLREHMGDEVVLLHRGARTEVAPGHILDRCLSGFRVRHGLRLSAGDTVDVLWPGGEFITEVVWSEDTTEGCEAGLRICQRLADW